MECRHFKTIELDISNVRVSNEVLDLINLEDDYYRFKLKGARNTDVKEIKDLIFSLGKDVCEVRDETHLPYDLEKISLQKNLKGIFTKKMLEYLKESPERAEEVYKAIDITFSSL